MIHNEKQGNNVIENRPGSTWATRGIQANMYIHIILATLEYHARRFEWDMEYQSCASKINTEGYYTVPQMISSDATQPQIQSVQNVWSQTIRLYNGYIYDTRQEQFNTRIIILLGICRQGVLCWGVSNSEKVRLSRGIRSIHQRQWSTREPDLRWHQVTSGNKDIIPR